MTQHNYTEFQNLIQLITFLNSYNHFEFNHLANLLQKLLDYYDGQRKLKDMVINKEREGSFGNDQNNMLLSDRYVYFYIFNNL